MIWTFLWNSILKRLLRRGGVSMLSLSVALFLPTICQTISLFYYDVNIYNQLNFNISFSIKYYAWLQPIRGSLMARSDNTEKCFQRYFWIIDRCVLTLGSRKRSNICPRQWLYITLSHYFQWRHITFRVEAKAFFEPKKASACKSWEGGILTLHVSTFQVFF